MCPEEQVIRVDAAGVVAAVADIQPVDRPVERLVGRSMGVGKLALVLEAAVAAVVHDALPFPATGFGQLDTLHQEALKCRD